MSDNTATFPSLKNATLPKDRHINYVVHSSRMDLWDECRRGWPLAQWAGFFQTYGDGNIQHSPEAAVQVDAFVDFCASLAKAILDGNTIAWKILAQHLPPGVNTERIRFAMSVQHKEGKTRYYSMSEKKVSSSESKAHDRRWEKVEDWMDGSVTATYRLARGNGSDYKFLEAYGIAHQVRETCALLNDDYGPLPTEMLGADDRFDTLTVRDQFDAFRSIQSLAKAWHEREYGERLVNCLLENLKRRQEENAQPAAGAA